jgi:hypothetical protein
MLLKFHSISGMKSITISAVLLMICITSYSQNLIGYKGNDIVKYMKENYKDMNYNNVVNSKFAYLKYSNDLETQTILFFLNPDSVCRSERIICDVGMKPLKVKEFNSKYTPKGNNKWTDKHSGKAYTVEIMDGLWSCIISIESEK